MTSEAPSGALGEVSHDIGDTEGARTRQGEVVHTNHAEEGSRGAPV
jgi:hypothetical protein